MITEKELRDAYLKLVPELEQWGEFVDKYLLTDLLKSYQLNNVIKIEPKFRSKNIDSFIGKALYRKKNYSNHLLEIEDKIGTRIVLLTTEQVFEIGDLIRDDKRYWDAKVGKDPKSQTNENPNQFDYLSYHITITPNAKYPNFNEKTADLLTCEIQVRTLLQHAYAEMSHDSIYKGDYAKNADLNRRMAKSMALMETTDDIFCSINNVIVANEKDRLSGMNYFLKEYKKLFPEVVNVKIDEQVNYLYDELNSLFPFNENEYHLLIAKKQRDLVEAVQYELEKPKKEFDIAHQPIIIYLFYMLYEHPSILEDEWPGSSELKKYLKAIFGFAE